MARFAAKFPHSRRVVMGLAAAGMLSACGPEAQSGTVTPDEVGTLAAGTAEQALAAYTAQSGKFNNGKAEFTRKGAFADERGAVHTRFQQTYRGVKVLGGEAITHHDAAGKLETVTDDFVGDVSVDVNAKLTQQDAISKALQLHGDFTRLTAAPEAELVITRHDGRDFLAYRVQLRQEDQSLQTAMPVYFIDAHTGEKVWEYDNLQTASATGSGTGLYTGTVSITTYLSGSTYYLEDVVRKVGTFDARNGTSVYRFTDTDNVWGNGTTSSTQSAGVDAHYGAEKVYDYYKNVHGRTGIDGAGGPGYYTSIDGVTKLISSVVHYSTKYNNAFWNGSYMTYGDGDGVTFKPLVTLDICGHEMTHGVTERTAGLVYSNESGALNESMSDVLGSMVERYVKGETANTWKIGEDAYTPATSGDALRYMNNPHLAGNSGYTADDDPDHYAERYTGTSDNGGVHINSGIPNYAFYLVAKGGTHHRSGVTVTGIGADAAAKIWYKALTTYMTSSTNFSGARAATLNAAAALYGSTSANYNSVKQAWTAVGVN